MIVFRVLLISLICFSTLVLKTNDGFSQELKIEQSLIPSNQKLLPSRIDISPFPELVFGEDNPYFSNIVTVQYQNSLLRSLIERQRKNQAIKESMDNLGLGFVEDPPPRGACEDLPFNFLCQRFYPDLYVTQQFILPTVVEDPLPSTKVQKKAPQPTNRKSKKPRYEWTDITCVGGQCRAVLIEPPHYEIRRTVEEGKELDDGWFVEAITAKGVTIEKAGGEKKSIDPAPSALVGGPVSPFFIQTNSSPAVSPANINPSPLSADQLDDLINNIESEELGDDIIILE